MTREEKSKAITEITEVLSQNEIIYLTDISGLNSIETSNLRRLCFKSGVKLEVMKNTLLEQAMTASDKDFGDLLETLKGNTSVMLSDVGNAPAKVIKDFRKKSEKPILKLWGGSNNTFGNKNLIMAVKNPPVAAANANQPTLSQFKKAFLVSWESKRDHSLYLSIGNLFW